MINESKFSPIMSHPTKVNSLLHTSLVKPTALLLLVLLSTSGGRYWLLIGQVYNLILQFNTNILRQIWHEISIFYRFSKSQCNFIDTKLCFSLKCGNLKVRRGIYMQFTSKLTLACKVLSPTMQSFIA